MTDLKFILLSGLPASGKTWTFLNQFSHLPRVDIKDIYKEYNKKHAFPLYWEEAQDTMLSQGLILMDKFKSNVVLEACLYPGTPSLVRIINSLETMKVDYEIVFVNTPYKSCVEHAIADFTKAWLADDPEAWHDLHVRLDIIESYLRKGIITR